MIQDVLKLCELQLASSHHFRRGEVEHLSLRSIDTLGETVDEAQPVDKLEPVSSAYARYAPDASFHDPIGIANGLEAVKAQFNSMPKLFSKSETKGVKVLDNPAVVSLSLQPLTQDRRWVVVDGRNPLRCSSPLLKSTTSSFPRLPSSSIR